MEQPQGLRSRGGWAQGKGGSVLGLRAWAVLPKESSSRASAACAGRPRPARLGCDPEHLGGASARRLLPCPQLPQRPTSQLPFISLFWWRKAGLSILETKIFPGSLYLLIFQFLAAALSAGGGGRAKFNAAGEGAAARSGLFSAGLRRQGREAAPGPPGHALFPPGEARVATWRAGGCPWEQRVLGKRGGCDESESEGARSRLPGAGTTEGAATRCRRLAGVGVGRKERWRWEHPRADGGWRSFASEGRNYLPGSTRQQSLEP